MSQAPTFEAPQKSPYTYTEHEKSPILEHFYGEMLANVNRVTCNLGDACDKYGVVTDDPANPINWTSKEVSTRWSKLRAPARDNFDWLNWSSFQETMASIVEDPKHAQKVVDGLRSRKLGFRSHQSNKTPMDLSKSSDSDNVPMLSQPASSSKDGDQSWLHIHERSPTPDPTKQKGTTPTTRSRRARNKKMRSKKSKTKVASNEDAKSNDTDNAMDVDIVHCSPVEDFHLFNKMKYQKNVNRNASHFAIIPDDEPFSETVRTLSCGNARSRRKKKGKTVQCKWETVVKHKNLMMQLVGYMSLADDTRYPSQIIAKESLSDYERRLRLCNKLASEEEPISAQFDLNEAGKHDQSLKEYGLLWIAHIETDYSPINNKILFGVNNLNGSVSAKMRARLLEHEKAGGMTTFEGASTCNKANSFLCPEVLWSEPIPVTNPKAMRQALAMFLSRSMYCLPPRCCITAMGASFFEHAFAFKAWPYAGTWDVLTAIEFGERYDWKGGDWRKYFARNDWKAECTVVSSLDGAFFRDLYEESLNVNMAQDCRDLKTGLNIHYIFTLHPCRMIYNWRHCAVTVNARKSLSDFVDKLNAEYGGRWKNVGCPLPSMVKKLLHGADFDGFETRELECFAQIEV